MTFAEIKELAEWARANKVAAIKMSTHEVRHLKDGNLSAYAPEDRFFVYSVPAVEISFYPDEMIRVPRVGESMDTGSRTDRALFGESIESGRI